MKGKIKTVLVKGLLGFLALNALLIVVGLFIPLTKTSATGNYFGEAKSLLSKDNSRVYKTFAIENVADEVVIPTETAKYEGGEAYHFNDGSSQTLSFTFELDKAGTYELAVDYYSLQQNVNDITIDILIDGKEDTDYQNINLATAWQEAASDLSNPTCDIYNNEVAGVQIRYNSWMHSFLFDTRYYQDGALKFELEAGVHTITINRKQGEFYLGDIYLCTSSELKEYKDLSKTQYSSNKNVIALEGERPLFKTDTAIQNGSVQNPKMYPYSTKQNRLNVLSGDSFNQSGFSVTYAFEVKEAGNYQITLKYANTQSNTKSYADILIDNVLVCDELNRYQFNATNKYKNETLKDNSGNNMSFDLTPGVHTITIQLDASLQSEIYYRMYNLVNEISELYLEVVKLTGGTSDKDKKWEIEKFIPNVSDRLNGWVEELDSIIALSNEISKVDADKDNTLTQYLENARRKIANIAKKPNELPHELANLSTGTSSAQTLLANSLHTSTFCPISIDRIYVHGKDAKLPRAGSNFILTYFATAQRVVKSGINIDDSDDILNVWVNRSTYYVSTLQKFSAKFTDETGIKVRFSLLPDESKLTYSYAAGTQPDMALGIASSVPFELGLRGALEDLTQFSDFGEVIRDFAPGAIVNLGADGAIYAIPETQDWQVLYYRKDLLDKYGLEVPNTWVDVIEMLPVLQRYGSNFCMPLAGGSGLKGISTTAPFIYQYGGDVYSPDRMSTYIEEPEAIQAINLMVDLFQLYSLPLTSQSFYDSFRNGKLPIGISGFDMYLQLTNAAPELQGKWGVALHPGVQRDINGDGIVEADEIDRTTTGDTKNGIIFKGSDKKYAAWKFLSWWSKAENQAEFANMIQSTYGATFLWNTANIKAMETLAMDKEVIAIAQQQLGYLRNVDQIPATYIVERALSNVWNQAVFDYKPLRALISDAVLEIDKEITRKMEEFGYVNNGVPVKEYKYYTVEDIKAMQKSGGTR